MVLGVPAVNLKKLRYTHDAMLDMILAEPGISQGQLAAMFGYTETWVSLVLNSDAFQARLAERKEELIDPVIRQAVEERLRAVANTSMEVIMNNLAANPTPEVALKAMEISTRALGYGAKVPANSNTNVQVNVAQVAVVPQKVTSSQEWAQLYSPGRAPQVVDVPSNDGPV